METTNGKSSFSLFMIVIIFLLLLVIAGGGYYFFKSTTTTTTTTTTTNQATNEHYRIAGSGSGAFALKNWTKKYETENSRVVMDFLPSADAAIAYIGVAEKTVDIGVASRLPAATEENPIFVLTPLVSDAIVVAVSGSVSGVSNLTKDQLIGIWSGNISNWNQVGGQDAKIVLIDREESESSKKKLRELYIGNTKVTPDAIEVHSEAEVADAINSTQYSIGVLSNGRVRANANLAALKLDGVGIEDIATGAYPFTRKYYVISRKDSSEGIKNFVRFVETTVAQGLYNEFGYFKP